MDKDLDAESEFYRSKFGGNGVGKNAKTQDGDGMGNTVLGDVTYPTPIVVNQQPAQQSGSLSKVLAGAAIAASVLGIPGAGIIGYLLSQQQSPPPVVQSANPNTDTSVNIGLGHIGDLFPKSGQ